MKGLLRPQMARLHGDAVAPPLNIERKKALVTVTWALSALGFVLDQNSTTFGARSQVAVPYASNGNGIIVSTPAPTGNKFYRLRKP